MLSSLAALAQQRGVPDLSRDLLASARTAAAARTTWLAAAQAWSRITTDARGSHLTRRGRSRRPGAVDRTDRLRRSRLDPDRQPVLATPPAASPCPRPRDLATVVAAVHQASETLTSLAAADHAQIGTAARAGRLLVPTRSLPDTFDVPHPFAPAPRDRIGALLATYHDARTASAQATATVAHVAADVRAPSRILTTARAAVRAGPGPDGYIPREPARPSDPAQPGS